MTHDICEGCAVEYPPGLVVQLAGEINRRLCGVCALKAINDLHGTRKQKFQAQAAESLRLQAIAWRKNPRVEG